MAAHGAESDVRISLKDATLDGTLAVPPEARGIVLFAHGSGSSRHSPRNRSVAHYLQQVPLATLLMDLLTMEEEAIDQQTRALRFDIPLLGRRLVGAIDWLANNDQTGHLAIGTFGASTGSAAALIAAAERPKAVRAVVSRGGRPDLAGDALLQVRAPTLLIVGGLDQAVIELNRKAMATMTAAVELQIVPGATHLFQEGGTLEQVARLTADWFQQHLGPGAVV